MFVYTEANSGPVMAYLASKPFAERASFDYVKEKKVSQSTPAFFAYIVD